MSPVVLQFIAPPRPATIQASVTCVFCAWGAAQTGPNAIEISALLRELLQRHLAERHPELATKILTGQVGPKP